MTHSNYLSQTVIDGLQLARRRHIDEIAAIDSVLSGNTANPVAMGLPGKTQAAPPARKASTVARKPVTKAATAGTTQTAGNSVATQQRGGKRQISAAGRKKIRAALKNRWAKFHAKQMAATATT